MGEGNLLKLNKKIVHILKIVFWASVFYLCFVLFQHIFFHNINFHIDFKKIVFFLFFNVPFVIAGQYWFLFALLYTYIFYAILVRFNLRQFAYWLAAAMFVLYICLAQGAHLAGIGIPNCIYRNWLVEGFAYFMLGHWIHEHQDEIHISNKVLGWIIAITTVACWGERYLLGRDFGVNICSIPQVFALFVYAVKNSTRHEGLIQRLGRDCSMLVYILHPAIWHSFQGVYKLMGISDNLAALYIMPVLVIIFSILGALLFNWIKSKFIPKKQVQLS